MCPRRDNFNRTSDTSKRQERETRRQEKKSREKSIYAIKDETVGAFNNQLRAFNLQLRYIVGDGNCLFRSFADQMEGDQHRHAYYREKICDYMRENRPDFEPFIVDESFDSFIRSLSKDGTFGGNECLVAFSRLFDAKICIHQLNQPVWIVCFSESPKHEIHISYHNYEHYSSVRKLGDRSSTSANVHQAMTTCDSSLSKEKCKKTSNEATNGACALESTELYSEYDVDFIESQLMNPVDREEIYAVLNQLNGDISETIAHFLTADIPSVQSPAIIQESDESIERIISITGIYDIDLVQQTFVTNNLDINSTIEALLKLKANDSEKNGDHVDRDLPDSGQIVTKLKTQNRSLSNRQIKIDKKKAKKQRATEKHRAQILAASGKAPMKQSEETSDPVTNDDQHQTPSTHMESISI